jgi:hypothetical protein
MPDPDGALHGGGDHEPPRLPAKSRVPRGMESPGHRAGGIQARKAKPSASTNLRQLVHLHLLEEALSRMLDHADHLGCKPAMGLRLLEAQELGIIRGCAGVKK